MMAISRRRAHAWPRARTLAVQVDIVLTGRPKCWRLGGDPAKLPHEWREDGQAAVGRVRSWAADANSQFSLFRSSKLHQPVLRVLGACMLRSHVATPSGQLQQACCWGRISFAVMSLCQRKEVIVEALRYLRVHADAAVDWVRAAPFRIRPVTVITTR